MRRQVDSLEQKVLASEDLLASLHDAGENAKVDLEEAYAIVLHESVSITVSLCLSLVYLCVSGCTFAAGCRLLHQPPHALLVRNPAHR